MGFKANIISAYNAIAQLNMGKLEAQQTEVMWLKLTNEYIDKVLTPLWDYLSHTSGLNINGSGQNYITEAQIFQAGTTVDPSRFYPTILYIPNPIEYLDLAPFKPPLLNGILTEDNGSPLPTLGTSEKSILETANAQTIWTARTDLRNNYMAAQDALDLSRIPNIEALRDSLNVTWTVALDAMDAMTEQPNPSPPPATLPGVLDPIFAPQVLQFALDRLAAMADLQTNNLIPETATQGDILYGWLSSRIHKVDGSLVKSDSNLLDLAIQINLDLADLNILKFNSFS